MMSMKGISSAEPDKVSRRISTHKRSNDAHSGDQLDVFEAAVYFSGHNEASSPDSRHAQKYGYNMAREENRRRWGILGGGRRISLDLPIRYSEQVHHHLHHEKHEVTTNMKERISNVRHKQPSSPGGRIASFLNSLFHQTGSKKNKPKPKPTDREVEEEIPGGGGGWMKRRRRSSISHFLSSSRSNSTTTTTTSSSKSLFSSSSSGFRTPPPYLNTPIKSYKQFLNYTTAATNQVGDENEKKINKELSWLDEKLKVMESLSEKQKVWAEHEHNNDDRKIKKERYDDDDNDDGMESDSSSDLFELQNYELSRGGLPVYETTNVANINNTHT